MGKTQVQLGDDLHKGKVNMNDFMKKAFELNQKGVDSFKSFEEQAKELPMV